MPRPTVALLGASGFAGAELIRRLLRHPHFELVRVCAADHVGQPVAAAHPNLEGATDLVFENPPPDRAVADVDVVVMGLPAAVSIQVVDATISGKQRVLDLSGAFRLKDAEGYARFYGAPHPRPDLMDRFVYGLPELYRERIRGAEYVASPGCFATTIQLGLLPLARAGLLAGSVHTVAVTGSSGSGVTPTATTHHPVRAGNLRTYRPLVHQHTPEIEHTLRAAGARDLSLQFVPVSAPLVRGIFATSFVSVPEEATAEVAEQTFRQSYDGEPFVRVPRDRQPEVVAVAGSNYAEVGVVAGPASGGTRTLSCFSALDNLIKGGAGQAIQNLNLMFGFDETLTLEDRGGYP